ncbi:MAG: hypothetical protein MH252_07755 [Thermosynechococcaceae cyanobacterium MS004]|nr:hypothetical protein [Thermosynechococcaceae cyanobacterium MS004]
MKPLFRLKPNRLLGFGLGAKRKKSAGAFSSRGFTLVELLVAGMISLIVIFITGTGLVSAMNMSQVSQSRVERQMELNRALDFISNEIRMSRSINESATLMANGSTVPLSDVAISAGINLTNLGNYGTIALYLERPIEKVPAVCPVGGPNAGIIPPNFDTVVYDIRSSPSGWLKPLMLTRYGRAPQADGTINPCSNPLSSEPMIDALSTTMSQSPTCSGLLSGNGGFYSCVKGKQVTLFLQSNVTNAEVKEIGSIAKSRLQSFQPQPVAATSCSSEAILKSTSSTSPTTIEFVNQTAKTLKVYWLDASGVRQYRFDISPNQTVSQQTFASNPWVVTDTSTNCLDVFVAPSTASVATIQGV